MNMWAPYIAATRAKVPNADEKIVFDEFHIAKHLGGCGRSSAAPGESRAGFPGQRSTRGQQLLLASEPGPDERLSVAGVRSSP